MASDAVLALMEGEFGLLEVKEADQVKKNQKVRRVSAPRRWRNRPYGRPRAPREGLLRLAFLNTCVQPSVPGLLPCGVFAAGLCGAAHRLRRSALSAAMSKKAVKKDA